MSLAQEALKKGKIEPHSRKESDGESPFQAAAREAFEAAKSDDMAAFSEALEAAIDIKRYSE